MKKPTVKSLQVRKEKLEARLKNYGLDNTITDSILFDETKFEYVHPQEAAERLLILLAVASTAYNFDQCEKVMDWLKKEQLWKAVSANEKEFFRNPDPSDEEKQKLSWRFEGAYILAWALNIVSAAPDPGRECNEIMISEFLMSVPTVGSETENFLSGLHYRPLKEIFDENLFYENATAYFRNIIKKDKENTSQVHSKASFERCIVLNWLKNPGETDWDTISNTN